MQASVSNSFYFIFFYMSYIYLAIAKRKKGNCVFLEIGLLLKSPTLFHPSYDWERN